MHFKILFGECSASNCKGKLIMYTPFCVENQIFFFFFFMKLFLFPVVWEIHSWSLDYLFIIFLPGMYLAVVWHEVMCVCNTPVIFLLPLPVFLPLYFLALLRLFPHHISHSLMTVLLESSLLWEVMAVGWRVVYYVESVGGERKHCKVSNFHVSTKNYFVYN